MAVGINDSSVLGFEAPCGSTMGGSYREDRTITKAVICLFSSDV